METSGTERSRDEIYSRLKWALFFRVVAVTLLLGATAILQLRYGASLLSISLVSIYTLVGATYLFTLLSAILMRWIGRMQVFVYVQVLYEVALITLLISITGRIFSFVYILTILSTSILLSRAGAFVAATLSTLSYAGLLIFVNHLKIKYFFFNPDFLKEVRDLAAPELYYHIAVIFAAFFMVAFFSSYLAEQLEQTGQQLREAEEDLEELEARSENIIRSLISGIITLDKEGFITSFNPAAEIITGRMESELLGKPLSDLFRGLDIANCPSEWAYMNPSGITYHLNFTATTLKGSRGQVIGELLSFQDMTAFREMQEQLKISDRQAAVGQLAAGLAHEIRNPLASISGSIQLLHKDEYKGDEERLMRIILRETDRLNKLISEFLQFARPTVGPARRILLKEILSETLDLFLQGWDPKLIHISLNCPDDLALEIDPNLLKQVLWNLYVNAAEAMEGKGGLKVNVDSHGENSSIRISVADTGPGIPLDIQEKIFTPFFTTKEYGTGLGLAIVYRSIESLGGHISIRSEPGKGTVVNIELPGRKKDDTIKTTNNELKTI